MWSVEYEGDVFERFLRKVPPYEQAVLLAAIEHVLQVRGIEICADEWGKPLGRGLYEFRVRKSLRTIMEDAGLELRGHSGRGQNVQIRLFCTFYGRRIVLLYHGYNKNVDPSKKRQQREIRKARKLHERWKARKPR